MARYTYEALFITANTKEVSGTGKPLVSARILIEPNGQTGDDARDQIDQQVDQPSTPTSAEGQN
jgi:hypothetical protein